MHKVGNKIECNSMHGERIKKAPTAVTYGGGCKTVFLTQPILCLYVDVCTSGFGRDHIVRVHIRIIWLRISKLF